MRLPFLSRAHSPRTLVLGLDGVPHSFLLQRLADGSMPHLAALAQSGSFRPARSVHPAVSCVAWASYMTGQNPGKHGLFGFQDLRPGSYQAYLPNGAALRSRTLWELLSDQGKRVIVMNVPVTYPPREVRGLLVGDFLAPRLEGATWPPQLAARLAKYDYKIDVDPGLARQSLEAFYEDLLRVHQARRRAFVALLREEPWDFAQCHVMGTDRINHFLWRQFEEGDPSWAGRFLDYYRAVDDLLGECLDQLGDADRLLLLSDHGFCTVKQEVNLNFWLRDLGMLVEPAGEKPRFDDLDGRTRVFSMTPGRFYLNLAGRYPNGSVKPDEAEELLGRLETALLELRDPEDNAPIIERVFRREELYHGPAAAHGPDLVAVPHDGYDLKGTLGQEQLLSRGALVGMHTYEDAFWLAHNATLTGEAPGIMDGAPTVLAMMGLEPPADMDGVSRLAEGAPI